MVETLDFDTSVPLLIVKLGRYMFHHGALAVARTLGAVGVPVYAIVEDRYTPLALSRYLTGSFRWTVQNVTAQSVLADLRSISKRLDRAAVLLPTDDSAAVFLAEHQADLEQLFIMPRLPAGLARRLCNKSELYTICRSAGLPYPETAYPRRLADVYAFIESAVFPLVVKVAEPQRLPNGFASTMVAYSAREVIAACRFVDHPESPKLLLQEYIPRGSEDWVYHGYRNSQNGCVVSFTGKKLRSWPPFAGPTTLGVCQRNDDLIAQTESLLKTIGYGGIMDLDYRLDTRDGLYKLLDFNPRLGANFRMFEDRAGLDVVRALHLDLTKRRVCQLSMEEGHTLVVESHDPFASLKYLRRGAMTIKAWRHSVSGKKELAWWRSDDPAPFFVMGIRLLARAMVNVTSHLLAHVSSCLIYRGGRRNRTSMSAALHSEHNAARELTPWRRLLLYVRTTRYLKPVQIMARLAPHRRFHDPGPQPLRACLGKWLPSIPKPIAQSGVNRFCFLNQEREINSWNDPNASKLWLYNLHYFEHVDGELVARWIVENPPVGGVGWDPYPTSLRIANWCKWILAGARPDPIVYASIVAQTAWLETRVEWRLLANHLLANAKALIFAGSLFEGDHARRWLEKGIRILNRELSRQILADGGHVERSPMYHSIILEDLLDLSNLRRSFPTWAPDPSDYASRMLGWLDDMVHPDGAISFFNDAALGIAPDREALEDYARRLGIPRTRGSLGDSGYRRLQNGKLTLIFDAAPLGPDYQPGHGHADALSFEVSWLRSRVLVNSGISTYDAGPERSFQVGTSAHNSLSIDGADQSEMWGAFRVARRARPFDLRTDGCSFVEAAHDGYRRFRSKITHQRRIEIHDETLLVSDSIEGSGEHTVELFYHLAPGATAAIQLDPKMKRETISSTYWVGFNSPIPNQSVVGKWRGLCPVRFESRITFEESKQDLTPHAHNEVNAVTCDP